jgi:CHASE3 domain sensor protein
VARFNLTSEPTKVAELRDLKDLELEALCDSAFRQGNPDLDVRFYVEEISRRRQDRQTQAMVEATMTMKRCTWVVTVLTALIFVLTVVQLWLVFGRPA